MKKWLWAIPVVMIAVTAVAIGLLKARDIDPEDMVADVDPREIAAYSEARVVTMLDTDPKFETLDFAVLDESGLTRLYVIKGEPEQPEPRAYNHKVYSRDLGNGWTYVLEYVCELTFSKQYGSQIQDELGSISSVVYYLRDKSDCAEPASRSKSSYAVEAHVELESGKSAVVFFDPKTKVLIGVAGQN